MQNPYSEENLCALEKKLCIKINNRENFKTAISRKAAKNENPGIIKEDNERLEFLGDSVLKFLISEYLFKNESNPEGKMTIMRSALENNDALGKIAKDLLIKQHLFLNENENNLEGKGERSMLADCLEAIIGAIYLDENNLTLARKFVENKVLDKLIQFLTSPDLRDPITSLQEFCQKHYGEPPTYNYRDLSESSQLSVFWAEVIIDNEIIAEAEGRSKQKARKEAAKIALSVLVKL